MSKEDLEQAITELAKRTSQLPTNGSMVERLDNQIATEKLLHDFIFANNLVQKAEDQSLPDENETNTWYKDDLGEAGRIGYRLGQQDMLKANFVKVGKEL